MKDEIEVGEYVRTNDGMLGKFLRLERDDIDTSLKWYVLYIPNSPFVKGEVYINKPYIVKHSKNIFKLLEGEDITVLEYYVGKYRKRIARRFEVFKAGHLISFRNVYCDFLYDLNEQKFLDGKGFNPKIKSILTHEQFESMEYKVDK